MTETDLPTRFVLTASPIQAAALLPALGRTMVGLSHGGATHERIGVVQQVTEAEGALVISGEAHESRLALAPIARLVADRSGGMRGKIFPRIEFQDAAGTVLMSVIGMDGVEAFDSAMRDWVGETLAVPEKPTPATTSDEPVAAGAGGAALEALRDSGGEVEIFLGVGPARQSWQGRIEEVKPAMGFANIIRPDFHLHLRDGSVSGFRETPEGWAALDEAGAPTGLVLRPLDATARDALALLG
ncbi:hypothetical protein ACQW02_13705 [Humitalea sp. 24SJ18S-53]|uniref:hypothetical protein n=1 Tax=Humitalea sp. 24SJ18S-53 TaxID=3422307 RepID=UPI003D669DA7